MRSSTFLSLLVLSLCPVAALGCASETTVEEGEDELTSITARSRSLEFEGYVYVPEASTDATILQKVRKQTQSAFGALKSAGVAANSRELRDVDVQSFQKTKVSFVDPNNPSAAP
ncbi:MAG: hypothetical protein KBF88_05630, partial [Polyangiaceae bacterium]|nr:hypothetical protein [Polyangiaceae bacterium]